MSKRRAASSASTDRRGALRSCMLVVSGLQVRRAWGKGLQEQEEELEAYPFGSLCPGAAGGGGWLKILSHDCVEACNGCSQLRHTVMLGNGSLLSLSEAHAAGQRSSSRRHHQTQQAMTRCCACGSIKVCLVGQNHQKGQAQAPCVAQMAPCGSLRRGPEQI